MAGRHESRDAGRRGPAAAKPTAGAALRHPERLRIALAGVVAVAMTLAVVLAANTAQGASGGTGPTASNDSGEDRYTRMWKRTSRKNKRWAKRTSRCESGGNRRIHGGGGRYHGAFQFVKSTWRSSPKSPGGDPHRYNWKTQAVVAIKLKKRDGARNHWPNCG